MRGSASGREDSESVGKGYVDLIVKLKTGDTKKFMYCDFFPEFRYWHALGAYRAICAKDNWERREEFNQQDHEYPFYDDLTHKEEKINYNQIEDIEICQNI